MGWQAVTPRPVASDRALALAFGHRVRGLRAEAGLTQQRLADAIALHPTFISSLERGDRMPSLPTLLRLARGLGVDPAQLVAGLDASHPSPA